MRMTVSMLQGVGAENSFNFFLILHISLVYNQNSYGGVGGGGWHGWWMKWEVTVKDT